MKKAAAGVPRIGLRTCVGCRGRAERSKLLRVVAVARGDGLVLVLDERRRLPGRGASLHARVECLDQAVRRKAFARALRVTAPLDLGDLAARVSALAETQTEDRRREQHQQHEQQEQHDTGSATVAGPGTTHRKRV